MAKRFVTCVLAGFICVMVLTSCGSGGAETTSGNSTGVGPKYPVPGPSPKLAPSPITAVGDTNQMTITWDLYAAALSYNIYWANAPGVTTSSNRIAGVSSPYIQTGLPAGTTYFYIVVPVYVGGEGLPTPECSGTTLGP